MKLKHTKNGNIQLTVSAEEAMYLNGALLHARFPGAVPLSVESCFVVMDIENLLDDAEVGAEY